MGSCSLRLRGLALWPRRDERLSLHAVLEQGPQAAAFFGQRPLSDLHHHVLPLISKTDCEIPPAAAVELNAMPETHAISSQGEPEDVPVQRMAMGLEAKPPQASQAAALAQIADNVVGIRSELQALSSGFRDFQGDFRRLVAAVEMMAQMRAPAAV